MITRIVSGLIALAVLFATLHFFANWGLIAFSSVGIAIAFYEYARLVFPAAPEFQLERGLFVILCGVVYTTTVFSSYPAGVALACVAVIFLSVCIWRTRDAEKMADSARTQMGAVSGFVYAAFFPALAVKLLILPQGIAWFMGLLAIVFTGDTFAYFAGLSFGKHKLNPILSPKKTIEGSIGGLLGSAVAGFVMAHWFLPQISLPLMLGVSLITGLFAQTGDLFESQIKRLVGVKDSGRIMPGHGGVLDRVDGVYFGAPVYFSLVWFLT